MTGNSAGSLSEPTVRRVVNEARASGLTPSPADWRDVWIYFLMVDRFNRPDAPPRHQPWDDPNFDDYQCGPFAYESADGDALSAMSGGAQPGYSATPLHVHWRDASGTSSATEDIATITNPTRDALVWPLELQRNTFFRRQGVPGPGMPDTFGDFVSLKQMRTEDGDLQRTLVEVYQYVIARWDVDGFRIDTLRYLHGGLPRVFGNAMREFAETVGKKNFFTFGEVFDAQAEQDIAKFIGRTAGEAHGMLGGSARPAYPRYLSLPPIVPRFPRPAAL